MYYDTDTIFTITPKGRARLDDAPRFYRPVSRNDQRRQANLLLLAADGAEMRGELELALELREEAAELRVAALLN